MLLRGRRSFPKCSESCSALHYPHRTERESDGGRRRQTHTHKVHSILTRTIRSWKRTSGVYATSYIPSFPPPWRSPSSPPPRHLSASFSERFCPVVSCNRWPAGTNCLSSRLEQEKGQVMKRRMKAWVLPVSLILQS